MHRLVLVSLALVCGLSLLTLSPFTSVYVALVAVILCGVLFARSLPEVLTHPTYIALILAIILLAATLPFVWQSPAELMIVLWMLPIPLAGGLVAAMVDEPRFGTPPVIGAFCLVGALGAMCIGTYDAFALEISRVGGANNPIHFGGIAAILGFASLVGLFQNPSRWRYVFLLGPVFGIVAVVLSGSRGPILSVALLFIVTMPLIIYWFRHIWLFWAAPLILGVGIAAGVLILAPEQSHHITRAMNSVQAAIQFASENGTQIPSLRPEGMDDSTFQRLIFLYSAYQAFLASPIVGHGAGQMISAAAMYFPEEYQFLGGHLHADIANFAVVGGLFALVAYASLLLAPFLALIGMDGGEQRRPVVLLSVILSVGYLSLGLTNAVFGIIPQTLLYGVLVAAAVSMSLQSRSAEDLI